MLAGIMGNLELLEYMLFKHSVNLHCTDPVNNNNHTTFSLDLFLCSFFCFHPFQKNRTLLEYAIANNHLRMVEFLINYGFEVNSVDTVSEITAFVCFLLIFSNQIFRLDAHHSFKLWTKEEWRLQSIWYRKIVMYSLFVNRYDDDNNKNVLVA